MKTFLLFITLLIVLIAAGVILPELAPAQAPPPPPSKPTQTPVDGGLVLLAVAGGTYAVNKLRRRTE